MLIKLTKDKDGKFLPTKSDKLKITDEEIRDMGWHHNAPLSTDNIFEAADKGYKAKIEKEGK